MTKPTSPSTSRRNSRRNRTARRPDARHAPGTRQRIARTRAVRLKAHPSVVLELADASASAISEIDVIEQHLGRFIDELLS